MRRLPPAESGQPLCFVNTEADEVVRSLFISRPTEALVTVSVFSTGGCCPSRACR